VLVVVDVVVAVVVVDALVVGSVAIGGSSARAAAAAPLPKRTVVASVAISSLRAMGWDYRRFRTFFRTSDRAGGPLDQRDPIPFDPTRT
jgi:hypothetical protein